MEIWKDIKGYEGLYQVSDKGNVRSLDRVLDNGRKYPGKVLFQDKDKKGYFSVKLSKFNKRKGYRTHRLVAQVFIPNPEGKLEVNHINEDKSDNTIDNLEWVTSKENKEWGTWKEKVIKAQSTPIYGIYLKDNTRVDFNSISEANSRGFHGGHISECINGKKGQYRGYKWYKL